MRTLEGLVNFGGYVIDPRLRTLEHELGPRRVGRPFRAFTVVVDCTLDQERLSARYAFVIAYTISPTNRLNESFSTYCL